MLKRFLNAAQSNPQLASGFKQKLGIGGAPSSPPQGGMMPPPPQGMRMRPPMMTNKARGTMASHFRSPIGML